MVWKEVSTAIEDQSEYFNTLCQSWQLNVDKFKSYLGGIIERTCWVIRKVVNGREMKK